MVSKQFFKSSIIYSLVGALPYTTGVILIPFFTYYLTPEQFGVNALYLTFMYFVQLLSTFGLDTYIGINYYDYKNDKQRLKEFIGTILMSLIVIGTLVFFLLLIGGNAIFHQVFRNTNAMSFFPFGLITVCTALFNSVFKSYCSLLINQQRPKRFFWLNLSNFILTLGASLAILYLFPFTLYGPVVGRLAPALLVGMMSVFLIISEFGLSFKKEFLKGVWSFCAPMVVYGIMVWIVSYIDRYIIVHFMADPTFVGIFDFAVKLSMGIDLVQVGLTNTIHPKVYNIWKDGNLKESTVEVNRYYNGLTAITLLIIPLVIIAVPLLVPLVIKKEIYYQAFMFLPILCLGFATRPWYYLFMAPLFFFKNTKALPRVFFFSATFQIIICSLLVWKFGLIGAMWSNFLVKPIQAFFLWLESRKIFHFKLNSWKIFYLPLIFIAVGIGCQFFISEKNILWFATGQLILSVLLVFFTYRHELESLFHPFLNRIFPISSRKSNP
jgi:O-antigen/teichoic acid export membrane protein